MNVVCAERTFPVALSTQWTSNYDKEIQSMLEFYSLCSYVLDKCSSRSVYLGVCAVQFALYLKLRVAVDQLQWNKYSRVERCIDDYAEHTYACKVIEWLKSVLICV